MIASGLAAAPARRRWFRAVATCVSLSVVAIGLAALPAAPAQAAAIYPPYNPGTDLTATADLPFPASDASSFSSQIMAPSLGLATSASPTQVAVALAQRFENLGPPPTSVTDGATPAPPVPATVTETMTVTITQFSTTTSTVTVTIPQSTISQSQQDIAGIIGFGAGEGALYAGFMACGLWAGRGLPATPPAGQTLYQQFVASRPGGLAVCNTMSYGISNIVSLAVNDRFLGLNLHSGIWGGITAFAALSSLGGLMQPRLVGWTVTTAGRFSTWVTDMLGDLYSSVAAWFSGSAAAVVTAAVLDTELGLLPENVPLPPSPPPSPPFDPTQLNAIGEALLAALDEAIADWQGIGVDAMGTIYDNAIGYGYHPPVFCADAYGGNLPLIPGQIVALNSCNGNVNQSFVRYTVPNVFGPQITDDGLCLAPVNETSTGQQKVILQWCDGTAAQSWYYPYNQWDQIVNRASLLCLDDPGQSETVSTQLQVYPCNYTGAQIWRMGGPQQPTISTADLVTNEGTITSGFSGDCLDAYGSSGGASPGQIAAINTCNGNPAQNWMAWSDGTVTIWGLCLDTLGGGTASGTAVVLNYCNGAAAERWEQIGNALLNVASGQCLDDPGAIMTPGTQVQIGTCNQTQAQTWLLRREHIPAAAVGHVAVRHLRRRRHAVRGGLQHDPGAVRQL